MKVNFSVDTSHNNNKESMKIYRNLVASANQNASIIVKITWNITDFTIRVITVL